MIIIDIVDFAMYAYVSFVKLSKWINTVKRLNRTLFNRTIQDKMQIFKESPLLQATNITLQKQTTKEMKGHLSVG